MRNNVVSFVDLKDRMSGREAINATPNPDDSGFHQLAELRERLMRDLAKLCFDEKCDRSRHGIRQTLKALIGCQFRVLHGAPRAIATLTMIPPELCSFIAMVASLMAIPGRMSRCDLGVDPC